MSHLEVDLARAEAVGEAVGAVELLAEVAKAGQAQHVRAGREGERGRHCRCLLGGQPPVGTPQKLSSQMLHACTCRSSGNLSPQLSMAFPFAKTSTHTLLTTSSFYSMICAPMLFFCTVQQQQPHVALLRSRQPVQAAMDILEPPQQNQANTR